MRGLFDVKFVPTCTLVTVGLLGTADGSQPALVAFAEPVGDGVYVVVKPPVQLALSSYVLGTVDTTGCPSSSVPASLEQCRTYAAFLQDEGTCSSSKGYQSACEGVDVSAHPDWCASRPLGCWQNPESKCMFYKGGGADAASPHAKPICKVKVSSGVSSWVLVFESDSADQREEGSPSMCAGSSKICHGWGDPHFTHSFFDEEFNFMGVGVFKLAAIPGFEVQGFQVPVGSNGTSSFAAFAVKIGATLITIKDKDITIDGSKITGTYNSKGLKVWEALDHVRYDSPDNCIVFNSQHASYKLNPFYYLNFFIGINEDKANTEGVCGSIANQQAVSGADSLFDQAYLEDICANYSLSSCVTFVDTVVPFDSVQDEKDACQRAGLSYDAAVEKCSALRDNTGYFKGCILDYCATGGDDTMVKNAEEEKKQEDAFIQTVIPPGGPEPLSKCTEFPASYDFGCNNTGGKWVELSEGTVVDDCRDACSGRVSDLGSLCCYFHNTSGCYAMPGSKAQSGGEGDALAATCESTIPNPSELASEPPSPAMTGTTMTPVLHDPSDALCSAEQSSPEFADPIQLWPKDCLLQPARKYEVHVNAAASTPFFDASVIVSFTMPPALYFSKAPSVVSGRTTLSQTEVEFALNAQNAKVYAAVFLLTSARGATPSMVRGDSAGSAALCQSEGVLIEGSVQYLPITGCSFGQGIQYAVLVLAEYPTHTVGRVLSSPAVLPTTFPTPRFTSSPWQLCDAPCGGGFQRRQVNCQAGDGQLAPASSCAAAPPLESQRACNTGACVLLTGSRELQAVLQLPATLAARELTADDLTAVVREGLADAMTVNVNSILVTRISGAKVSFAVQEVYGEVVDKLARLRCALDGAQSFYSFGSDVGAFCTASIDPNSMFGQVAAGATLGFPDLASYMAQSQSIGGCATERCRCEPRLWASVSAGSTVELTRVNGPVGACIGNAHLETPLMIAARDGHEALALLIVQQGKIGDVNVQDSSGNTALSWAALRCCSAGRERFRIAKLLLDSGADVDSRNKAGYTAGDLASDSKLKELLFERETPGLVACSVSALPSWVWLMLLIPLCIPILMDN